MKKSESQLATWRLHHIVCHVEVVGFWGHGVYDVTIREVDTGILQPAFRDELTPIGDIARALLEVSE